ncbi:hypothetical protein DOY81_005813 [Sarcophaga bullata]|nr:hypothetical protein DOY81_005813 [Sarcophaga bullata]
MRISKVYLGLVVALLCLNNSVLAKGRSSGRSRSHALRKSILKGRPGPVGTYPSNSVSTFGATSQQQSPSASSKLRKNRKKDKKPIRRNRKNCRKSKENCETSTSTTTTAAPRNETGTSTTPTTTTAAPRNETGISTITTTTTAAPRNETGTSTTTTTTTAAPRNEAATFTTTRIPLFQAVRRHS